MILDYNAKRGLFWLACDPSEADRVRHEYGFDLSVSASDDRQAVLFTSEPYAAASFASVATAAAREQLSYIIEQIEASRAENHPGHFEVPADKELWPFQKASVAYALSRPHALVADEPGLGKTPIAITVANEIRASRVLVVCPASIRGQWRRRVEEWSTMGVTYTPKEAQCGVYTIVSSKRGVAPSAYWTIVSWDLVRSPGIWKALAAQKFDLLILDEAHYVKTADARRTRAIFGGGRKLVAAPLFECAERTLALSGTPIPNRPREAYVLGRHLCWEAFDFLSEDAFQARFNPIKLRRSGRGAIWLDERVGRLPELQNRLRANFMVRHAKRDVLPQLRMPVFDLIRVEETVAVKEALQVERLLDIDPEMLEGANASIFGHVAEARRLMGIAMAPQVAAWIEELIRGGEDKLTVFGWHIEVLDILEMKLSKYGCVRVDGRDSSGRKAAKVRKFIEDPAVRIIMGNVLSLGTGTDGLQEVCNHALIAEADWVFGNNLQCIDRLDRGGQRRQVQADIFVAPGSIAEKVLASALRKGGIVERALDRV